MIGNIHDLRDHFHYYVLILSTVVLGLFTFQIVVAAFLQSQMQEARTKAKNSTGSSFQPTWKPVFHLYKNYEPFDEITFFNDLSTFMKHVHKIW